MIMNKLKAFCTVSSLVLVLGLGPACSKQEKSDHIKNQASTISEIVEKEQFPMEKILTISLSDYCENIDKSIKNYKLVGIHASSFTSEGKRRNGLLEKIPEGTEVVVDYKIASSGYGLGYDPFFYESGTALIPKTAFIQE